MSVIRKVPYIEALLASMTTANLKDLRTVLNTGGNNVNLDFEHLDADTYKNKVTPVYFKFEDNGLKTGILIWTNSMCALICYHRFQDVIIFELSPTYHTSKKINEYCDINELRRVLDDTVESTGAIDSGSAAKGAVPFADGQGGVGWDKPVDYIKGSDFPDGTTSVKMIAIDDDGDLVKVDIPEGTVVVDSALSDSSENPVQNKIIDAALTDIEEDITEINGELETKANVDGNYPTMTVGAADNLTPYDESAGDDQDDPFLFQATGTGNGSQADFATGALALMKEKRGNSVVVNQLVDSGTTEVTTISGHKYLTIFSGVYAIVTSTGTAITINDDATDKVIDLTQWFNDDIPADLISHPEHFFRYYQGSLAYNTGTIVNANSRYIKCIGRQQWDEEWENGYYNDQTGEKIANANYIKSKNLIKVIPNATYYLSYITVGNSFDIYAFDKDNNFIGPIANDISHNTFNVPSNCCYIGFNSHAGGLTTYSNDITISLYYEGESGYDQYYAYEELTNNDTGTEELKSAGSAADSKTPDGTITRRIGSVDLSTLSWAYNSDNNYYTTNGLISLVKPATADGSSAIIKWLCSTAPSTYADSVYSGNIGFAIDRNGILYFKNSSTNSETSPTGTLYYELATPTTEQGTPFSENLIIDDFGSMEFSGTSGVPQGNLIFYPVDYKAFVDTLYDYTEGTPSDIAKKSDLTPLENQGTILQNAIGGTLRQCLCVKETLDFEDTDFVDLGSLNWTYDNGVFGTDLSSIGDKGLCTKYDRVDTVATENQPDKTIQVRTGKVYIKDTTYTDATVFKAAMKGVLLAYEKAGA